jgi:hypothetical protein
MSGSFGRMPQARYAHLSGAATHPAGATHPVLASSPSFRPAFRVQRLLIHLQSLPYQSFQMNAEIARHSVP